MGACGAAIVRVEEIQFRREFRDVCAMNTCGRYGACWMCPPDVGDIDEMITRARRYTHAFVYQYVGELRDYFDEAGMEAAMCALNDITAALREKTKGMPVPPLALGAGYCRNCERCGKTTGEACRHPDRATASLESHGVAVYQLAELCGMDYTFGANMVTYFGALLYSNA